MVANATVGVVSSSVIVRVWILFTQRAAHTGVPVGSPRVRIIVSFNSSIVSSLSVIVVLPCVLHAGIVKEFVAEKSVPLVAVPLTV